MKYRSYVAEYWRKDGKPFFTGRLVERSSRWQREADAESYLATAINLDPGREGRVVEVARPAQLVVCCGDHPQGVGGKCFGCKRVITEEICRELSRVPE